MKNVEPEIVVNQKAAVGSDTTQIAVQNNYSGFSPKDASDMAFGIFREYFPQLKEEALAEVRRLTTEKLEKMNPEEITTPSARIVVPTLQNASITEEADLREMYAAVLAKSMNKKKKGDAHPSYVEIINQLCSDEAKILKYITRNPKVPIITIRRENDKNEGVDVYQNFSNIGELVGCEYPYHINRYFDNLVRLGLLEKAGTWGSLTNKDLYKPLENHEQVKALVEWIENSPTNGSHNKPRIVQSYMSITSFGESFCHVCIDSEK